jgi:hypothetical protein
MGRVYLICSLWANSGAVMRLSIAILFGALVLTGAVPALAQSAPIQTASPPTAPALEGQVAVDAVTVRAANRKRLLNYVKGVAALSSDGQVSRRPDRLCPYVVGAPAEVNTYVASRLRQVGETVGVKFEAKACQPNLLVLFSNEPETMLRRARKMRRINFSPATPSEIDRFLGSTRPVRWWHSVVVTPSTATSPLAGVIDGPAIIRMENTRMLPSTRSVIRGSLIVVDAAQAGGVEVGALADYIAFAALTDVKLGAEMPDQDTILNLFAPGITRDNTARRLTPIDLAYLRGVYKTRDTSYGMNQVGKIAAVMAEELER